MHASDSASPAHQTVVFGQGSFVASKSYRFLSSLFCIDRTGLLIAHLVGYLQLRSERTQTRLPWVRPYVIYGLTSIPSYRLIFDYHHLAILTHFSGSVRPLPATSFIQTT